jgi:RHS repeat-associated protein
LPDGPGSVRGLADDASIGVFSGQVAYSVPIELPESRGGFGPSLSLTYAGELGNGPLGVGWSLGHASIRRSTRHGVPSFSSADELELSGLGGGGRLVRVAPNEYRVEGQGNALRVVQEGTRFVVTDADGTRYFFGLTAMARQEKSPGQIYAWHPEVIAHRSGKEMAIFYYGQNRGQIYLERIAWGPDYRFEALLEYEARPDETVSFREGFQVITNRRLARVNVRSGGAAGKLLRTYHLEYENVQALSRLSSVRMTGLEGQGELPTLSLSYGPAQAARMSASTGTGGWELETRGVAFFDVDGDGMDDLYRLEMGNHEYRKNLGGRFGPRTPLPGATALELGQVRFLDLDGDARPELVRIVDDTWRYSKLTGGGWETIGTWPGTRNLPLSGPGVEIVDLDGDGRMDVVQASTGGILVSFGAAAGMSAPASLPPIDPSNLSIEPGASDVRMVDFNGDGLADVVWLAESWMKVFLGRGDGTFAPWRRTFYPWPTQAIDLRDLRLADLDRDGLLDLVRFTAGHVLFFPGLADGSFSLHPRHLARPESESTDVTVAISDANGNGSADIVWSSPRGMWILDVAGPTTAGMLTEIRNGLGKVMRIEYTASAELAVAAENAGEPWERKLPTSIPVPTRVTIDPGSGPERIVHHGVRDGFWDGAERRFGGFLEGQTSRSGLSGAGVLFEVTRFHPGEGTDRVLRGKPVQMIVANGLGQLKTVTHTEWAAHPVTYAPAQPQPLDPLLRVAVTREVRSADHEGVIDPGSPIETLAWFVLDDQARVIEEHQLGRLDEGGDESVTKTTYAADNDELWIRDRVCETRLESGAGELISRARTYFGGPTGSFEPLCEIGLGLERQVQGWLEGAAEPWIVQSSIEYTPGWNPALVYAGGVTRTLAYDADDLYLISESVSPQAGTTLTWTMDWDEIRGLPESLTDTSGVITTVTHDELGRLATVAEDTNPAHTHYVYDWAAPYPTTTTFTFDKSVAELSAFSGSFQEGAGWRQSSTVANGAGEALFSATRLANQKWAVSAWTQRDPRGRPIRVAEPFHWDTADVRGALPPIDWPGQTVTYDAFDRIIEQKLPTGARRAVQYAAFKEIHDGDDLSPVTSFFDGQGRIIRTERTVDMVTESVDATYDPAGRLLAMSLQDGQVSHVFSYDTLGRLIFASDPDIGDRHLRYNDKNFLVEHENAESEIVALGYDGAGRLIAQSGAGGAFTFHYDETKTGTTAGRVPGRLAWVEEPSGEVELSYDAFGRRESMTRTIGALSATETLSYSPSGLVLSSAHDHNFTALLSYDDAGRLASISDGTSTLWQVTQYDPAGRILAEQFGNGVEQLTDRDELGQAERIQIIDATGATPRSLYDVAMTRNAYGAITDVSDTDNFGLDHTATFTYDGAARLTAATLGGMGGYSFGYEYDGLQNMIERTASGPTSLGALLGTYRYAESGAGPRQLSSVLKPDSSVHSFTYDLAGRLTNDGGTTLSYNGLDQLVSVQPASGNPVSYSYGYDGLRTLTTHPDGTLEHWFAESLRQLGDERHHYIRAGDRTIARVTMLDTSGGGSAAPPPPPTSAWRRPLPHAFALAALALLALAVSPLTRRRPRRRLALAPAVVLLAAASSCSFFGFGKKSVWVHQETLYFHHGVAPGPVMMTREDATVFSERRYEPFGQPIDNFEELVGGGSQTGPVDFLAEPLNSLNKPTDPTTGFSYHGARWMASATARWVSPDPIVKAPDPKFMAKPWGLHPYHYVEQNPVLYWDPDGRAPDRLKEPHAWEAWQGLKSGTVAGQVEALEYAFLTEKAAFGDRLREWGVRGLKVLPGFKSRGIVGRPGAATLKDIKRGIISLGEGAFDSELVLRGTIFHEALHIRIGREDIARRINPLHDGIHQVNHVLIYEAEIRYLKREGASKKLIAKYRKHQRMYLGQIKDPVARRLARRGRYKEAKNRIVSEQPDARLPPPDPQINP